jgi:hypothetical protein
MTRHSSRIALPIWVRVPTVVVLVLVGVLTGTVALGAADIVDRGSNPDHAPGQRPPAENEQHEIDPEHDDPTQYDH